MERISAGIFSSVASAPDMEQDDDKVYVAYILFLKKMMNYFQDPELATLVSTGDETLVGDDEDEI